MIDITLSNAKLDLVEFLELSMFDLSSSANNTLKLSNITLLTDCYTLYVYQTVLLPALVAVKVRLCGQRLWLDAEVSKQLVGHETWTGQARLCGQ